MKINKTTLLFIATLFFLALPLVLTGNAMAKYRSDGAVQNTTTGAWEVADPGQCYVKDTATTGHIDPAGVDRTTCRAIISTVTVQADCIAADAVHPTYKGRWSGGVCTGNAVYENTYTAVSGANDGAGDREGCLHCHDGMNVSAAATKTKYMKTGHKNMLRQVTAGTPQLDPADVPYADAGAGTSINWTAGEITTSTGTWPLKWVYGDWMAPGVSAMYLDGTKNMSYSCSKCHATGTSIDNAINVNKEPVVSGTLTTGQIGSGAGQIKLDIALAGYTGDHYASWDQWGIMCSRCHSSASAPETAGKTDQTSCETAGYVWVVPSHGSAYCTNYDAERLKWNPDYTDGSAGKNIALLSTHAGGASDGPTVVRLCGECHRQEISGQPYTYVGTINGTPWDKGFGDQAQTVIGGLSHGAPSPAVGHNYMNVFLNSPHAKFTGTYGQITNIANYDSKFMKAAADGGLGENGCVGCHNVHESVAVDGHEPFENECTDCHSASTPDGVSPQVDLSTIRHPVGPGTPIVDMSDPSHACETCHMPAALHFFRINTDESYKTKADYSVTGPDNTAADGTYASAVWVDLDLACGQCHGGGTDYDSSPSKAGVPYMTKAYLAAVAPNMHGISAPAPVITDNDVVTSVSDFTVTMSDNSASGANITVNWNDGSVSTGVSGATFTHTYTQAGTFTIKYTAELNGKYKTIFITVVAPNATSQQITGTVSGYSGFDAANTSIYLKQNGITKAIQTTAADGFFTFDTAPGNYTIQAYKYGETLTSSLPGSNPGAFTLAPDTPQTISFSATQTKFALTVTASGIDALPVVDGVTVTQADYDLAEAHLPVVIVKYNGVTKGISRIADTVNINNLTNGSYDVSVQSSTYDCGDSQTASISNADGNAAFTCTKR
jgi:PKD domain